MNTYRTAVAIVCAGLVWCSVASAGITTTGSVDDNPTIYLTHIHVAYAGDGTLAIDDDSDLARDIVSVGYVSGHTGTATVTYSVVMDNDPEALLAPDGVHFTPEGYQVLGQAIADYLLP